MGKVASKRVVILGAGRVSTHLTPALMKAGYRVVQVWSRTEVSARALATPLGISYTDNLDAVVSDADVYIACVSDGALPDVTAKIVLRANKAALFLHTAGSVEMNIWQCSGAVHYGILYPLQTFSKERIVDIHEVPFFVEAANEQSMERLEVLALSLSNKVFRADSKCRERLHVAAVFACNFTNAMYDVAQVLLAKYDIPFEVLLPLIDETAAKVHMLSPHDAQTGPAVRGDKSVIEKHLSTLSHDEILSGIYVQISDYINKNR